MENVEQQDSEETLSNALEDLELRNKWTATINNWNGIASLLRLERMKSVLTNKDELREATQVFSFLTKENKTRADKIKLSQVVEMEAFTTICESQVKICQSEAGELEKAVAENDAKETVDGFVDVVFTMYYDAYLNFLKIYAKENPNETIREWCEKEVDLDRLFKINFTFYDFLYKKVGDEAFKRILGIGDSGVIRQLLISAMEECIANNYTKFLEASELEDFEHGDLYTTEVFNTSGGEVLVGGLVDENYKIRKPDSYEEPQFQEIIDSYLEEYE